MKRRGFLAGLGGAAVGGALVPKLLPHAWCGVAHAQDAIDFARPEGQRRISWVPARHYEKLEGRKVLCRLCPRECRVARGERGYCGVRENRDGDYFTLVHGRACAIHVDPIEKKPLFHFLPGTQALSLATAGCNMECRFCQNWEISQFRPEQVDSVAAPPAGLLRLCRRDGVPTIAYTYSEPTIFYEYMLDIARATHAAGMHSVVISNGYIQEAPLRELAPHLSAYKVDLKAYTPEFYKQQCNATLPPVLQTLRTLRSLDLWTEIVVLIIPTLNDAERSNREMFRWIQGELGPDVPVHLTRFHPTYKIRNLPRTPIRTLERLHAIAREEGLHFVYVGNAPGHAAESTYCPSCGERVIERYGYFIGEIRLDAGCCGACGAPIPGVWS
ncbi:MAG: AmmeMemoRadiSam system radical SAM enzyme [Candidatus Eisenbacteria bacterium]|nr:AmmeMemoRadiSam system radical SAM enzyme [Candidatus Eisenbacteria bacterium]